MLVKRMLHYLKKDTIKNNQETLILEIDDKQKAEDKKLEIERLNAVNSIKPVKKSQVWPHMLN